MSIETNKALAARVCRLISDRKLEELFALFHEDGSWTIPYHADFPYAGRRNKSELQEMLTGFLGGFDQFSFSVKNLTAEDNRVAVEATSVGKGPNNADYQNVYHIIMEIKDGKIHTVREYMDPYQVMAYAAQIS